MNLEIHKPELAQRVQARIQSGHFHDADELIEKALDALDEQATAAAAHVAGLIGAAPKLPRLHLGVKGALHRRDIYDDVR
jgi:Arc/MetJ-type ribon-helix-helix transcriptional regulator